MTPRRATILAVALLLFWSAGQATHRADAQPKPPVLILVAASMGGTDISLTTLRGAYENQTTIYRGSRLIPLNLPTGTPARQIVDRVLLSLTPDRVGTFWIDQKIRHGIEAPRSTPSPEMMVRAVGSLKGLIGYVQMNPSAIPSAVTVLTVDGKKPSDPAYALRAP